MAEPRLATRAEVMESILDSLTEVEIEVKAAIDPDSGRGSIVVVADRIAEHIADRVWRDFFAIPGACDDPGCNVLHSDPERPIHHPGGIV